jgi:hypothetical protein
MPSVVWNPNVLYCGLTRMPMGPFLCHMDLIHTHTLYFLMILHSTPSGLFLSAFSTTVCMILHLSRRHHNPVITSKIICKTERLARQQNRATYTPANRFLWRYEQLVQISTLNKTSRSFPQIPKRVPGWYFRTGYNHSHNYTSLPTP